MAVLSEADRDYVRIKFNFLLSNLWEDLGLTKAEVREAVDATDQWIEDNQVSYNANLPNPARTVMTTKQKAMLFMFVADKRFNVF